MSFWASRRVLVTGASGFLGSHVVEALRRRGCTMVTTPRRHECDLVDGAAVRRLFRDHRADIVIHLAARVGGIGANRDNPATFFYENAMMGLQLMEEARHHDIDKFVVVGTICAYPKFTPVPFREEDLWNGYPEETNAPYGLAKRMLLVQADAYRRQYGFNAISLLPVNLYGPRDNFDPSSSHVIPALMRKFDEAMRRGDSTITVWGDGTATREFLYVEDAADGILLAAEHYDGAEPVNVGSGAEISIRDLALLIKREMGFKGHLQWDTRQPNGQPRRLVSTVRAEQLFGFRARTSLAQGLARTVAWYRQSRVHQGADIPIAQIAPTS